MLIVLRRTAGFKNSQLLFVDYGTCRSSRLIDYMCTVIERERERDFTMSRDPERCQDPGVLQTSDRKQEDHEICCQ